MKKMLYLSLVLLSGNMFGMDSSSSSSSSSSRFDFLGSLRKCFGPVNFKKSIVPALAGAGYLISLSENPYKPLPFPCKPLFLGLAALYPLLTNNPWQDATVFGVVAAWSAYFVATGHVGCRHGIAPITSALTVYAGIKGLKYLHNRFSRSQGSQAVPATV